MKVVLRIILLPLDMLVFVCFLPMRIYYGLSILPWRLRLHLHGAGNEVLRLSLWYRDRGAPHWVHESLWGMGSRMNFIARRYNERAYP